MLSTSSQQRISSDWKYWALLTDASISSISKFKSRTYSTLLHGAVSAEREHLLGQLVGCSFLFALSKKGLVERLTDHTVPCLPEMHCCLRQLFPVGIAKHVLSLLETNQWVVQRSRSWYFTDDVSKYQVTKVLLSSYDSSPLTHIPIIDAMVGQLISLLFPRHKFGGVDFLFNNIEKYDTWEENDYHLDMTSEMENIYQSHMPGEHNYPVALIFALEGNPCIQVKFKKDRGGPGRCRVKTIVLNPGDCLFLRGPIQHRTIKPPIKHACRRLLIQLFIHKLDDIVV